MATLFADCLEEPLLRQGFDYWSRLLQSRRAPARRDIDPADIPNLLPHVMLTDVLRDGRGRHRYRFRLVGTEVEQAFGRPMTGWHIDEILAGEYRAYVLGLYDEVVRRGTPVFSRSGYSGGGAALEALRLMMPLSSDGDRVDMVFSVQAFHYQDPAMVGHGMVGLQDGFLRAVRVAAADCGDAAEILGRNAGGPRQEG